MPPMSGMAESLRSRCPTPSLTPPRRRPPMPPTRPIAGRRRAEPDRVVGAAGDPVAVRCSSRPRARSAETSSWRPSAMPHTTALSGVSASCRDLGLLDHFADVARLLHRLAQRAPVGGQHRVDVGAGVGALAHGGPEADGADAAEDERRRRRGPARSSGSGCRPEDPAADEHDADADADHARRSTAPASAPASRSSPPAARAPSSPSRASSSAFHSDAAGEAAVCAAEPAGPCPRPRSAGRRAGLAIAVAVDRRSPGSVSGSGSSSDLTSDTRSRFSKLIRPLPASSTRSRVDRVLVGAALADDGRQRRRHLRRRAGHQDRRRVDELGVVALAAPLPPRPAERPEQRERRADQSERRVDPSRSPRAARWTSGRCARVDLLDRRRASAPSRSPADGERHERRRR